MAAAASLSLTTMRSWRNSPNLFCRQALRLVPDAWQDEVLEAAGRGALGLAGGDYNPTALSRICLKASKGPGKSTALSWIGWWFLCCFTHPKVICTSISGDNLRDGLWAEFSKWQKRSELLKALFTWQAERIVHNEHPETWWCSARNWSRSASSEQQSDTLAGIHADNVLFLVDEGGGIPDAVVATAEAGLANADPTQGRHALLVVAGNPTELAGPLYRACTKERALWYIKEISGDPDDPKRAPRVSKTWAQQQIDKYGREHPWVLVNVFGKFPPGSSNTLLGVEAVITASQRVLGEWEFQDEVKILGVDVARFGDDETVILMRQGKACFAPRCLRNQDTMQVAGQVALVMDEQEPDACFIDVGGIGAGVVDRLKQLHYPVTAVDFGSSPIRTKPKVQNRRTEMWWHMADWVREGGSLPDDAVLLGELPGPTFSFTGDNTVTLESKKDMKKRGFASPNRADALALTFAAPVMHKEVRSKIQSKAKKEEERYHPYVKR